MIDDLTELLSGPQQMSHGERAALEGVLVRLSPALAIEIGTAEGGTLRRIAAHATEVHSLDLVAPPADVAELDNVTFHTGDSHELLPRLLAELSDAGRNVDFVLVDGDHTPEGACRDVEDLLASPAIGETAIVIHDMANELVRDGVALVDFERHRKVKSVDLSFVAGYLFRNPPGMRYQLWGGLGLVLVDAGRPRPAGTVAMQDRVYDAAELLAQAKTLRTSRPGRLEGLTRRVLGDRGQKSHQRSNP